MLRSIYDPKLNEGTLAGQAAEFMGLISHKVGCGCASRLLTRESSGSILTAVSLQYPASDRPLGTVSHCCTRLRRNAFATTGCALLGNAVARYHRKDRNSSPSAGRQGLSDVDFFQATNWVTNKSYMEKQIALSHKAKIRVMPLRVKVRLPEAVRCPGTSLCMLCTCGDGACHVGA